MEFMERISPSAKRSLLRDASDLAEYVLHEAKADRRIYEALSDYNDVCEQIDRASALPELVEELCRIKAELVAEMRRKIGQKHIQNSDQRDLGFTDLA